MKIEISEESFQFLKELIHEINTQDNRMTAQPILYTIHEKVERDRADGRGETRYYDGEETIYTREEVIKEFSKEEDRVDEADERYSFLDLLERIEKEGKELEPIDIETTWEVCTHNTNVFLTEKACRQHIRVNEHNLKEPRTYVNHAFRNPEMECLIKAIKEIVENKE